MAGKKQARQAEIVPFTDTKPWASRGCFSILAVTDDLKNTFKDVTTIGFFLYEKFVGVEFLNQRASHRHSYVLLYVVLLFSKRIVPKTAYKKMRSYSIFKVDLLIKKILLAIASTTAKIMLREKKYTHNCLC